MPAPITPNKKPAAATDHGGLNFVFLLAPLTSRKDSSHDLVHDQGGRV